MQINKPHLFWQTLDWNTYIRYFFRNNMDNFLRALSKDIGTNNVLLTSSGRAGIMLSLRAANIGRNEEVFIPPYLNSCVLDSIVLVGMPSLEFTERTKAVLLYHHWGYSQNFPAIEEVLRGRKIPIIEDCAHGLWGETYGVRIGEFGDTAIFSLSKIFEITYAGALRINNKSYIENIINQLNYSISLREFWEAILGEWTYVNYYRKNINKRNLPDHQVGLGKWYSTLLTYPACKGIRGNLPGNHEEIKKIFRKQNSNFLFLLENLKNKSFLLDGDNLDEMAPLCYPVLNEDESILEKVNNWLKELGIYTGIYHFDVNRNMFKPNYMKCVPIPLYASIDTNLLKSFVGRFKEEV